MATPRQSKKIVEESTLSAKNQAVLASMKQMLNGETPAIEPTLAVDEDFGVNPLPAMWDKINKAIEPDVMDAELFASELENKIKRRTDAYIARGLINQAFEQMANDVTHPYFKLNEAYVALKGEVDASVRIAGGIKVGKAPLSSPMREELREFERKINRVKNAVASIIAQDYGMTPDEVFQLVREEHQMYEQQNKAHENGPKAK